MMLLKRATSVGEFFVSCLALGVVVALHLYLIQRGEMPTQIELSIGYPLGFLLFNFLLSKLLLKSADKGTKKEASPK